MAVFEVKAANLLGTGIRYAYAVKSGPWIFLTGHEAFDLDAGIPEAVAGAPRFPLYGRPRWRREGDFILQRMRQILQEFGSDLAHGVRLDQFYPTPAAVDPYHLARRAAFGDYIPPSTSVVMERCFGAESGISSSLLAVVPSTEYEIHKVYPKDVTASTSSGFVPTVVCNDFVFVAGQMASGGEHGLDPRNACPGPHGLGRNRNPQADGIHHCREAEAGPRSRRILARVLGQGSGVPEECSRYPRLS